MSRLLSRFDAGLSSLVDCLHDVYVETSSSALVLSLTGSVRSFSGKRRLFELGHRMAELELKLGAIHCYLIRSLFLSGHSIFVDTLTRCCYASLRFCM